MSVSYEFNGIFELKDHPEVPGILEEINRLCPDSMHSLGEKDPDGKPGLVEIDGYHYGSRDRIREIDEAFASLGPHVPKPGWLEWTYDGDEDGRFFVGPPGTEEIERSAMALEEIRSRLNLLIDTDRLALMNEVCAR